MIGLVSITSQGQISIPAVIRHSMGLDRYKKVVVRQQFSSIIIEPVRDLLSLGGSLKNKALKNKSIAEIRKIEQGVTVSGFIGK